MPPKRARGYVPPERLPANLELSAGGRRWRLGQVIGQGGFGDIYSAAEQLGPSPSSKTKDSYVIKIEPHENGPLFVEMHFYMRNAKQEDVESFMKTNKLKQLGMPLYIASGSHKHNDKKYRFIVMQRFGEDLWRKFIACKRRFPAHTVFRIALQMLDVYEYIHSRKYIHADLKGNNILIGLDKGSENQLFLVDYGLATHFTTDKFKNDPKKAHNGTIEYTSRDAHNGVSTRRGDMEILGYNLVQWLSGTLPWESDLKSPVKVQGEKEKYMANIPNFMEKSFKDSKAPGALVSYLQYVQKMKYDDTPDYKYCRQLFETALKSLGYGLNCNLEFTSVKAGVKPKKAAKSDKSAVESVPECVPSPVKASRGRRSRRSLSVDDITIENGGHIERSLKRKPTSKISDASPYIHDDSNFSPIAGNSINSSVDIFEDSCIETPPKRAKRKHTKKFAVEYCTDEEVTVHTTVKKKGGVVKEETRSWKKCPTIVNGRTLRSSKTG